MRIKIIFLLLFTSAFLQNSYAQFDLYLNYDGISDDNIFNTSNNVSDFINSFSLGTAYNIASDINNVHLYYEGSLNYFKNTKSKSFNAQRFGIVETHLFSIDENPLNAGINYSIRNNKDEYTVYDFNQLSAYINYRHSISETDFILPGYIFNKNDYKNFTLYSNNEHRVFLTWMSSFQTRTSLSLNGEYLFKDYVEKYYYEGYLNEASLLRLRLNVGQSLGDNTGMNVYCVYQNNLSEGSRYVIDDSLIYYEEEIFNDIYSYDGIEIGLGFRHYVGEDLELSFEAAYMTRNYSSLPAADLNGDDLGYLREDKRLVFGVGILYNISGLLEGLYTSASWNYFKNDSNDPFYTYTNQIITFSLGYGL